MTIGRHILLLSVRVVDFKQETHDKRKWQQKIIIVKYCDNLPYINVSSDKERQFLLFSVQHHTRPLQIW